MAIYMAGGNSPEQAIDRAVDKLRRPAVLRSKGGMISCDGFIDLSWAVYQAGGE